MPTPLRSIDTPLQTNKRPSPFALSLLWFGIQLAWGAVLGLSLQARYLQLTGAESIALFGLVSGAGGFAAAIVQLVVGPYSDRLRRAGDNRVRFYIFGAAFGCAGLVAFYLAPTVPTFVLAYVLLQIAMNVAIGPYQAIIPDFIEQKNIGVASGWMAAMQSGGNAIGAIAATLLGNTPQLGMVLALILAATALATIRHLRGMTLRPIAEQTGLQMSSSLIDLFVSRAFVYLGFYTLLAYFYFYVRNTLPQPYPTDPNTASGICILIFTLVGAGGAAIVAKAADRFDERVIVTLGGGIVALGIGSLSFLHSLILIPVIIGFAGIGWGIFLCADWAFACRLLPPGSLASTMAIWNIAIVGPQMLAPLIATAILATTHASATASPRIAFLLACAELLLGALWIWRLPKRTGGHQS